jgi:hypothetical protein
MSTTSQQFTVGGQKIELSREDVESRLEYVPPEEVTKVFVYVDGRRYPIKQALAVAAGLIRSGFTTQEAIRVFRNLDFTVGEGAIRRVEDYFQIVEKIFRVGGHVWRTKLLNSPGAADSDEVQFRLGFTCEGRSGPARFVTARASDAGLHHDLDNRYKNALFQKICDWLGSESLNGELRWMG